MPSFDTHSTKDAALWGFSNHHLTDDLVLPELFAYILIHHQTAYMVNGCEDRALKLAHSHRLAERWLISTKNEQRSETDLHYAVQVKFTVQRATDNMQNSMLYAQRYPARNFGLAWLPGSRAKQFFFCLVMLALFVYLGAPTLQSMAGIVSRGAEARRLSGIPKEYQPGNGRWSISQSNQDWLALGESFLAHTATLFWSFIDWVMALCSQVRSAFWETYEQTSEAWTEHRWGICLLNTAAEVNDYLFFLPPMELSWADWLLHLHLRVASVLYRC
jgi:hypothetical protein